VQKLWHCAATKEQKMNFDPSYVEIIAFNTRTRTIEILGTCQPDFADEIKTAIEQDVTEAPKWTGKTI
jgi:hypothetical protein